MTTLQDNQMNSKTLITASLALAALGALAQSDQKQELASLSCPVLGNPVSPQKDLSIEYRGLSISFCCPGCDAKFLANPEKYLEEASHDGKTVAISLFDPVNHKRLALADAAATLDFQGIRYPFATAADATEFRSLPGSYAYAPSRESVTCPVMKKTVESHSSAAGFADFRGVRYYFCCPGCDEDFAKDPEKFAASVAEKVRPVAATAEKAHPQLTLAPTCAGCAGEARLLSNGGFAGKFTAAYRFVAIDDVAARHRFTLDYAVTPRLTVGIERSGGDASLAPVPRFQDNPGDFLRFSDGDALVMPRFSWFVSPEKENCPSFLVGMASDRLSTPRGQAFFATASKHIAGTPVTPFLSIKTNTFDGRTVMPFGVNYALPDNFVLQAVNDGDYTHFLFTKMLDRASVSLLLARSRYFGFSVAVGF